MTARLRKLMFTMALPIALVAFIAIVTGIFYIAHQAVTWAD